MRSTGTAEQAGQGGGVAHSRTASAEQTVRGGFRVEDESNRTRLIGDLTRLIREPEIPESTRTAGLELIGWLARRMPGESAHDLGVEEARQSERMLRATRRKSR
jgi:hypothetical protein